MYPTYSTYGLLDLYNDYAFVQKVTLASRINEQTVKSLFLKHVWSKTPLPIVIKNTIYTTFLTLRINNKIEKVLVKLCKK